MLPARSQLFRNREARFWAKRSHRKVDSAEPAEIFLIKHRLSEIRRQHATEEAPTVGFKDGVVLARKALLPSIATPA
jgi:hypothetical protein